MSGHIQSPELRACKPYLLIDDETTGWTGKKKSNTRRHGEMDHCGQFESKTNKQKNQTRPFKI